MAYQALYRKWRPRTFDGVVGQTAITDTLKNAIKRGKISHALLFAGPRGTGNPTGGTPGAEIIPNGPIE